MVVDDDQDILDLLEICLTNEGYDVITATNGQLAIERMDTSIVLVILDVMMPIKDGIKTCIELRKNYSIPVIFLTAKAQDSDLILGLQVGADDYIKKPFAPAVLIAKVKAALRRYQTFGSDLKTDQGILIVKDLVIDVRSYKVMRDQLEIPLTKTEFEILTLLARNRGQVFSIQRIYTTLWKEPYFDDSANTVMVHIKRLRHKVEIPESHQEIIQTVWGVGYKID